MDRNLRGLTAGITAAAPKYIWNLIDYYLLHLTSRLYLDWPAILIIGRLPGSVPDFILATFYLFLWEGLMGIIFAFLIRKTASRAYIINGIMFSFAIDFIFRILVVFYQIPVLSDPYAPPGMISSLFAVFLWGGLTGLILKRLDTPH